MSTSEPGPGFPEAPTESEKLFLKLDGFDGPLDLLLELARAQKFDLSRISIAALVDQYLEVLDGARKIKLELAADWLVMAAWLTWLKSKLLLPKEEAQAVDGEIAADVLAKRLKELNAMRQAAAWLGERPVLGQDVFGRGSGENLIATDRSRIAADLPLLLRAYVDAIRRGTVKPRYQPRQLSLWTVQDAIKRLAASLPGTSGWSALDTFLPANLSGRERNAAVASTLIASLEMARGGGILIHQEGDFAPIMIAPGDTVQLRDAEEAAASTIEEMADPANEDVDHDAGEDAYVDAEEDTDDSENVDEGMSGEDE
jgi:segregation and condensation protein A